MFIVLFVSTVLIFTRLALLSFFCLLLTLAVLSVTGKVSARLVRAVWAYIGFFCFLTLFAALWSILNFRLTAAQPLIVLAAVSWAMFLRPAKRSARRADDRTWPGLLAGAAVAIYVCIPLITHPSAATVLRYSAKTTDDVSHIARIEAIRSFGGLLYQKQAATTNLIDPGTSVSPQGWHVNGAFIESLIIKLKGSDTVSARLFSYVFYKTLWLAITVFLLYSLMAAVREHLGKPAEKRLLILSFLGAGSLYALLLVAVYGYGFQNFIASIGLVSASLIIAIKSTGGQRQQLTLLTLAVLTVTALYDWTLAGGVVGLITLAVLARNLSARYRRALSWNQLGLLGLLVLLAAFPVYELVRLGSQRGLHTVNTGGATPPIRIAGVFLVYLVTIVVIYISRSKARNWLMVLLTVAGLEFGGLAAYQLISLGETKYYAIKLAFLFAAICVSVSLPASEYYLKTLRKSNMAAVLTLLILIVELAVILGLSPRKAAYPLRDSAPISTSTAQKILSLSSSKDKNAVIYTPNKGEMFLANKLWSSVQLYNTKDRKALLQNLSQQAGQ